MKRILIADDHPVLRLGVRELVKATEEFRLAAAVRHVGDIVPKAREVEANLVLLDPAALGSDLASVLDELRSLPWTPSVVAFTACEKEHMVLQVLAAGVHAYVLKDEEPEVLLEAMRTALSGQRWFSGRIALKVIDRAVDDFLTNVHPRAGKLAVLTSREREVLRLVGLGLSNLEIAEALCIRPSTAHGHVSRVVGKLQLPSRAAAIAFALREGMVDLDQAESGRKDPGYAKSSPFLDAASAVPARRGWASERRNRLAHGQTR